MQGVELVQARHVFWRGGVMSAFWSRDDLLEVLDARHGVRSLVFSLLVSAMLWPSLAMLCSHPSLLGKRLLEVCNLVFFVLFL